MVDMHQNPMDQVVAQSFSFQTSPYTVRVRCKCYDLGRASRDINLCYYWTNQHVPNNNPPEWSIIGGLWSATWSICATFYDLFFSGIIGISVSYICHNCTFFLLFEHRIHELNIYQYHVPQSPYISAVKLSKHECRHIISIIIIFIACYTVLTIE